MVVVSWRSVVMVIVARRVVVVVSRRRLTVVVAGSCVVVVVSGWRLTVVVSGWRLTVVVSGWRLTVVVSGWRLTVVLSGRRLTVVVSGRRLTVVLSGRRLTVVLSGLRLTVMVSGRRRLAVVVRLALWRIDSCASFGRPIAEWFLVAFPQQLGVLPGAARTLDEGDGDGPRCDARIRALDHGAVQLHDSPPRALLRVKFDEGVVQRVACIVALDEDARHEPEARAQIGQRSLVRVWRHASDEDRVVAIVVADLASLRHAGCPRRSSEQHGRAETHAGFDKFGAATWSSTYREGQLKHAAPCGK
jgi:hypothetical protein